MVESIPHTISPSHSKLIGFNCEIVGYPITAEEVCSDLSQHFGSKYMYVCVLSILNNYNDLFIELCHHIED